MDSEEGLEAGGLKRALGPLDATCVVVGAIIGVGIFFQPSAVAATARSGEIALTAWVVGGAIALLGALTLAELGAMYRRSGGQYEILRDSYGPLPAFLFVFCNATAVQAGAMAIIAIICTQNLGVAFGVEEWSEGSLLTISILLVAGLAVANGLGVRQGSKIQNVTVFAKVATLLLITTLALIYGEQSIAGASVEPADTGDEESPSVVRLLFAALVPTLFAFGGWQQALWVGGEIRDPTKNVPRAILGGVVVVVVLYILANAAYLWLLGPAGVAGSKALAADAVGQVWPGSGTKLVAAAVAFSAFGVLNAQLLSGPRLIFAMARDGRFFSVFAKVHPRTSTPLFAIGLLAGLSIALLLVVYALTVTGKTDSTMDGVGALTTGVVFIDAIFFILTGLALFVLRRKRPDVERPVRVLGFPFVPALFVLGETAVLLGAYFGEDPTNRAAANIGAYWILGAVILYLVLFRSPARK